MKRNKLYLFISILTLVLLFTISAICNQCTALQTDQQFTEEAATQSVQTIQEISSQSTSAIKITNMSWNPNPGVIEVSINEFTSWGDWTMYVDGTKVSMEGGAGNPVVRPNAELEDSPTGLLIGTEPWPTSLAQVDFPICGTIQFDIPGEGLTNEYQFNLSGSGCKTASTKQCQTAEASQENSTQTTKTTTAESTKDSTKTTTTTTASTTKQGLTADIRPTDIYPDKLINGVIFARVTNDGPDTLNSSKVSVTVSGSKEDLANASTANFIAQPKEYILTLKPGETQIINLEIGIDTSKYSYSFTVTVSPVGFADTNNANNSYTEKVAATQNQQGTQGSAADIIITDLYPDNYPVGILQVRVTNKGPGTIENKKIEVTVSGSVNDPSGASSKNFISNPIEFTISLKPGETKVITPKEAGGSGFQVIGILYRYNYTLTVRAIDFIDANENNNTYSEKVGTDKVIFSFKNNTGGAIGWDDSKISSGTIIRIYIYPTGQQNKGDDLLGFRKYIKGDYDLIENGQTIYFLINPGTYDMQLEWADIYLIDGRYGVNITGDYNWELFNTRLVLQAPEEIPIWGFFIGPPYNPDQSNNLLKEIIPSGGYKVLTIPAGTWSWAVNTYNNKPYHWEVEDSFFGINIITLPIPGPGFKW